MPFGPFKIHAIFLCCMSVFIVSQVPCMKIALFSPVSEEIVQSSCLGMIICLTQLDLHYSAALFIDSICSNFTFIIGFICFYPTKVQYV